MADPATLAITSIGASAGGSLLSAFGAKNQAQAQSQVYNYQAGIAQVNKQIAEQNRDYALAAGEQQAGQYGLKARQQAGQIRAAQGASGIAVNSGSSVDVQEGQAQIAKMDLATIRNNAARVAYGYTVEAANQDYQSTLYKMAASNTSKAGNINALASLVSGAGSVSSKWLQATQSGAFSSTPVFGSSYDSSGTVKGSLY